MIVHFGSNLFLAIQMDKLNSKVIFTLLYAVWVNNNYFEYKNLFSKYIKTSEKKKRPRVGLAYQGFGV